MPRICNPESNDKAGVSSCKDVRYLAIRMHSTYGERKASEESHEITGSLWSSSAIFKELCISIAATPRVYVSGPLIMAASLCACDPTPGPNVCQQDPFVIGEREPSLLWSQDESYLATAIEL